MYRSLGFRGLSQLALTLASSILSVWHSFVADSVTPPTLHLPTTCYQQHLPFDRVNGERSAWQGGGAEDGPFRYHALQGATSATVLEALLSKLVHAGLYLHSAQGAKRPLLQMMTSPQMLV